MKDLIQRCLFAYVMGATIVGGVMLGLFFISKDWKPLWFGVLGIATTVMFLVLRAC